MYAAHIASDFTSVYCAECAAAGTIFETIDVYELGFSYVSISIFNCMYQYLLSCISGFFLKESFPYTIEDWGSHPTGNVSPTTAHCGSS